MKKYTKVYMDFFGYGIDDFIPCEVCGKRGSDIHHIIPRSQNKSLLNKIFNLICLCRECHNKAEAGEYSKDYLMEIHRIKIESRIKEMGLNFFHEVSFS